MKTWTLRTQSRFGPPPRRRSVAVVFGWVAAANSTRAMGGRPPHLAANAEGKEFVAQPQKSRRARDSPIRHADEPHFGFAASRQPVVRANAAQPERLATATPRKQITPRSARRQIFRARISYGEKPRALVAVDLQARDMRFRNSAGLPARMKGVPPLSPRAVGGWRGRALAPIVALRRRGRDHRTKLARDARATRRTTKFALALTRVFNENVDRLQSGFEQANALRPMTPRTSAKRRSRSARRDRGEAIRTGGFGACRKNSPSACSRRSAACKKISTTCFCFCALRRGKKYPAASRRRFQRRLDRRRGRRRRAARGRSGLKISAGTSRPGAVPRGGREVGRLLRRMLLNLVDNAVPYNRADGEARSAAHGIASEHSTAGSRWPTPAPDSPRKKTRRNDFHTFLPARDADVIARPAAAGSDPSVPRNLPVAHGARVELAAGEADARDEFVSAARRVKVGGGSRARPDIEPCACWKLRTARRGRPPFIAAPA